MIIIEPRKPKMKYPNILFYRYEQYAYVDLIFEEHRKDMNCTVNITSRPGELKKLYDSNYHILVTFGENPSEYYTDVYSVLGSHIESRWVHVTNVDSIEEFNNIVNVCFISFTGNPSTVVRPEISIFTTCYHSYEKIKRPLQCLERQTFTNWEWVIIDDSGCEKHFDYLKTLLRDNSRVRLFQKDDNNGSIGNVKNEAVSLCRGKYVVELDHDDDIVEDLLEDSVRLFSNDPDLGFIYTNYANIYENGNEFYYCNGFSKGYAGYYLQKYHDKWLYVANSPNINNITLSHITCVPNHARIWRKSLLMDIGNYNEYLPISDDYEVLLRTCVNTKVAKLNKLGYIQYMNDNNNNFSLIRNGEINRLCSQYMFPIYYQKYDIHEVMKSKNAYEDEQYIYNITPLWKRPTIKEHKYCNTVEYDHRHEKFVCILTVQALVEYMEEIQCNCLEENYTYFLLDNVISNKDLCNILDKYCFTTIKCFSLKGSSIEELIRYYYSFCGPFTEQSTILYPSTIKTEFDESY